METLQVQQSNLKSQGKYAKNNEHNISCQCRSMIIFQCFFLNKKKQNTTAGTVIQRKRLSVTEISFFKLFWSGNYCSKFLLQNCLYPTDFSQWGISRGNDMWEKVNSPLAFNSHSVKAECQDKLLRTYAYLSWCSSLINSLQVCISIKYYQLYEL